MSASMRCEQLIALQQHTSGLLRDVGTGQKEQLVSASLQLPPRAPVD